MSNFLSMFFLSVLAFSQEQAKPQEPMDLLRPLVGSWSVVCSGVGEDGKLFPGATTESFVTSLLDGKILQEQTELKVSGMTFRMLVLYSYDPFRKVYRLAAMDHLSGMMDIAEGTMKDGALVVDNLRAKTFFPWGDGTEGAFRLTKRFIDHDHFTIDAEVSFDTGKTWKLYTHSEYSRK